MAKRRSFFANKKPQRKTLTELIVWLNRLITVFVFKQKKSDAHILRRTFSKQTTAVSSTDIIFLTDICLL